MRLGQLSQFPVLLIHPAALGTRGGREVPVGGMEALRAEGLQERASDWGLVHLRSEPPRKALMADGKARPPSTSAECMRGSRSKGAGPHSWSPLLSRCLAFQWPKFSWQHTGWAKEICSCEYTEHFIPVLLLINDGIMFHMKTAPVCPTLCA